MPTEVALDFNKDAGLLLFVDVPALFVVFCDVETVFKRKCTNYLQTRQKAKKHIK